MQLKKSSLFTKLIILGVMVYATITLVSLQTQITAKQQQAALLDQAVTAAEQENLRLQAQIDKLGTPEGVEEIARNKLGLVKEGEIVFYDSGN